MFIHVYQHIKKLYFITLLLHFSINNLFNIFKDLILMKEQNTNLNWYFSCDLCTLLKGSCTIIIKKKKKSALPEVQHNLRIYYAIVVYNSLLTWQIAAILAWWKFLTFFLNGNNIEFHHFLNFIKQIALQKSSPKKQPLLIFNELIMTQSMFYLFLVTASHIAHRRL